MVKKTKIYKQKQNQKQVVSIHIGDKNGKRKVQRKRRATAKAEGSSNSSSNPYYQPFTPVYIQSGQAPYIPENNPLLRAIEELNNKIQVKHVENPRVNPLANLPRRHEIETQTEPQETTSSNTNTEPVGIHSSRLVDMVNRIVNVGDDSVRKTRSMSSSYLTPQNTPMHEPNYEDTITRGVDNAINRISSSEFDTPTNVDSRRDYGNPTPMFSSEHPLLRSLGSSRNTGSGVIPAYSLQSNPSATFNSDDEDDEIQTVIYEPSDSDDGNNSESDTEIQVKEGNPPERMPSLKKSKGRPRKYLTEEEKKQAKREQTLASNKTRREVKNTMNDMLKTLEEK